MHKSRFLSVLAAMFVIVAAALALTSLPASSAPIFTGDAVADFSGPAAFQLTDPGGQDVGLPPNAPPGTISGWDMRAVYVEYDSVTDTLYVGFDCYGICGDADGDGDPAVTAPWLISNGGQDLANLSSFESFSLLIDTDNDYNGITGDYDVVVGVSAFGSLANLGAYLFNQANVSLPSFGYLGILPNSVTAYASPSAAAPDLELAIANFHALPGFTFLPGDPFSFQINAFGGSLLDDGVGEDFAPAARTPVPVTFNGKLGDLVWYDLNGNGVYEPGNGEFGLGGVEVCLTSALGGAPRCTSTDSTGYYEFDMLPPSAYVVTVSATNFEPGHALSGFTPTYDLDGGLDNQASYNLAQGETFLDLDFGYTQAGAIGNYIWLDENSDGYQDVGEPGLPNVSLNLYDANGALAATTVTDSQGGYLFVNLAPGTYYVDVDEATLPAGMTQSPYNLAGADFGNQDHSSAAIPGGGGLTGYPVTLGSGEENLTADFGYNANPPGDVNNNQGLAAIGDRIWSDSDGDGVQDSEEVGLAGVTVQLFTAGPDGLFGTPDDVAGPTDVTDANGYYLFDNLTPGAYVVKVTTPPAGYTQTGDPDHFGASGANNDNQTTTPVLLTPGDVFLNADFGYQPPAAQNNSVGDKVWFDADADGVGPNGNGGAPGNDNNETGIPGVSVALIADLNNNGVWEAGEPIIASDTTNATGDYLFTGLPDGSYLVWVNDTASVLSAYTPTYDIDGGATTSGSGAPIGATASATLGLSSALNLGVGSATPVSDLTHDFGYTAANQTPGAGLIGDRIWLDSNGDGVQDANEPGLEGVTVILKDNNGNTVGYTTTDENGNYYFGGLAAGTYTVVVTPPAGMSQTYDADGLGTAHQSTVSIGPGGINLDQDFGYRGVGTIGDLVWEDLNANGSVDAGETGIGGVTLDLYWDLNGNSRVDVGEPLVGSAVTAGDGSYLFSGLPVDDGSGNAQFVVDVTDTANALAGYWHSLGAPGANNNSQTDAYPVTLTPGAPDDLTADFGYYVKAAALGNFVWSDLDGDGIQDAGEPGLNNVKVTLTAHYAGGASYSLMTLAGDDPATVAVEMGWYGFGNLLLDEDTASSTSGAPTPTQPVYALSAPIAPYGLIPTVVGAPGSTLFNDSDNHTGVDGLTTQGRTNVQQNADPSVESNPNATYDFGYLPVSAIGNYIWLDENSDGYQDAGEPGIANVALNLYDENGLLVATSVTDSQGGYLFSNLTPGTYYVDVNTATLPVGVTQSPYNLTGADFGNQDHSTLAIPGGGGLTGYLVDLTANQENLTADFGYNYNPPNDVNNNTGTAALGDRVWSDADGDGVQDVGEPGLAGVTVQLFTAGPDDLFGTPDDVAGPTTNTTADGYYLFDGLTPGAYVVKVTTPPTGYTQTGDPDHFAASGANNDNQTTTPVLLAPGDVFLNADFGYQPPAAQNNSLGDFVWFDADADGIGPNGNGAAPGNDNSELPIPGVTVALIRDTNSNGIWDAGESIIATAITGSNGYYLFPGLPDGSYLVWVNDTDNVLSDKAATYDADGGTPYSGSGAPIGVASSATLGLSSVINLGVGSATPVNNLAQDFGYTAPHQTPTSGLIGDRVWLDINGDGVQDANEPGLEGLTVTLTDNNGNIVAVVLTDENGNYAFGGLPAGTYTVVVTPPAGMTQTYDADGLGTAHQSTVSIGPGGVNVDQDFGYRGVGTIGDLVWEDLNANGSFDTGEPAFGGVTLALYWDLNGNSRVDSDEPLVGNTTTAANGSYLFSGLPVDDGAGNAQFVVRVTDAAGVLAGYWHSLGTVGANNNSQTDPYAADLTPGAPSNLTADFGYFVKAAALGNFVWNDLDGDGIQDAGEPGLNNVRVTLTAHYANGVTYSLTTLTGDDPSTPSIEMGWYGFGNLLFDEDTISSTTGAPTSTQPVYTLAAPTGPYGLIPTVVGAPGSTPLNDSDNHTGVDGLATQGRADVEQNANPNVESDPIASYDFGFFSSPAEVTVEKTQVTGDPILVGDEVIYNIRITNTGPTVINILPLQDAYDTAFLSYNGATPSSDDNIDDGVINWSDLTIALGNLNPGSFVDVTVRFTAVTSTNSLMPGSNPLTGVASSMGAPVSVQSTSDIVIGGINLGELPAYLFLFANGSQDANWQGATKGFIGNVAVDGLQAHERTSGGVPYAGTIFTNDNTLSAWANIVDQNDPSQVTPAQAFSVTGQTALISDLETDLLNALTQIAALPASVGYASVSSTSLNSLNTQNGIAQTLVINITSGLNFSSKIMIKGDAADVFVLRWDTDGNPANGYQGQVKPQSGGAIVPQGGLKATNFINVAGDINSSGGGSNPPVPYPQGPRFSDGTGALIVNGSNFNGGGFFTGYWLTTGNPTSGDTASLSNGIFVGGWYTTSDKFSMTSGTSGVYVSPNQSTLLTKDYGDAPDTGAGTGVGNYNTVAADNGPSHVIVANLHLGNTAPDADNGTLQNATASADDSNGADDEDGVSMLPVITTDTTSVPLAVNVYNNTGVNATVACWIDFNRDGDFMDVAEHASAVTGSSASLQTANLTFSGFAAPSEGPSYLRCRVANNATEVFNPTGAANSGEVEDYALTIDVIITTCDTATVENAADINGGIAPTVSDDACSQIEQPGSIGDLVWYDINSDGLFQPDAGEIGVGGVEVCLTTVGGGPSECTTTDNAGYYLFDELPPDSYVVTISAANFEPTAILAELKQTFDADAVFDHQTARNLATNEDYLNADFGYSRCAACKGGVVSVVFRYVGAAPATVLVSDRNGVTLFSGIVNPGDLVPLANPKPTDKYEEPTFYVNGSLQVNRLKMDCSLQMGRGVTYGDFEVVRSSSKDNGNICPAPTEQCGECKGGVTALSIKYNGPTAANIQVKQDDGVIIFNGLVNPGSTFAFNGLKSGGTMGTNITVWVNGVLYKTIHTSCSQAIYVGQIIGDLEIVAGSSKDNGAFCTQACAECSGGVTFLKLQYLGLVPATIQVNQSNGQPVFNHLVNPGEIFTFTGTQSDNKLGNEIAILINGTPHATLHTSCSQPIELGMLVGDFKIMGGGSKDGGLFCPRGPRFCSVAPGMFVLDSNKAQWTLENHLDTTTIGQITLEWPATNGRLKKIKLDGNEIFSGLVDPGVFVINSGWKNDLADRQIEAGQIEKLEFEFENNVSRDPMVYHLAVDFVEGCHVELVPEEIVQPYCEAGKPQVLTFTYVAQDCTFSDNSQAPGKAVCTDYLPLDGTVFIRSSDNINPDATSGAIYFQGIVSVNTAFDVDATLAGQSRLGTNTYVHIFDVTGAVLQQSNGIHTSCSQPLLPDDQYGSLRLTGYTPAP